QNFGIVEEGLYRCGQPNELNFPFMEKLKLKRVIFLAPEEPHREFTSANATILVRHKVESIYMNNRIVWVIPLSTKMSIESNGEFVRDRLNFVDDHDIELLHLGKSSHHRHAWTPIEEETVVDTMRLALDPKLNYPLMIMCNLGRHRTGTFIGCLRKLQRWNLTSIFEEYRRYAGSKVRLMNEQFIEFFDTDLISIPVEHPNWLCGCRAHAQPDIQADKAQRFVNCETDCHRYHS
ncbi:tyrosine-protein phosphatase, partial [Sphaeroforma arctica JP610]